MVDYILVPIGPVKTFLLDLSHWLWRWGDARFYKGRYMITWDDKQKGMKVPKGYEPTPYKYWADQQMKFGDRIRKLAQGLSFFIGDRINGIEDPKNVFKTFHQYMKGKANG